MELLSGLLEQLVHQVKWIKLQVVNHGAQVVNLEKGKVDLNFRCGKVRWLFFLDHESMVSAGLKMLTDAVTLSTNEFVTLSIPRLPQQAPKPISITDIFSSQIDASSFNQATEIAFIYLRLGHYRNQLLHLFVEDAMLALCLAPEIDYGMYLLLSVA